MPNSAETARRVEDLRAYAAKERKAVTPLMVVAVLLYVGAAILGIGPIGWAMLIAAVALSFYIVVVTIVVFHQSSIAELLEHTLHPSTHSHHDG